MKKRVAGDGSRSLNTISQSEPSPNDGGPKSAKEVAQERRAKTLVILKGVLIRCCGGCEYGFFFIPKRKAFEEMHELLGRYSSNININIEPPLNTSTEDEDDIPLEDWSARTEFILARARAKIAQKLMLRLRGSMRVVTLSQKPLHSFPIDYGSFCELIRSFEEPQAFNPKRLKKYLKTRSAKAKSKPSPIFFKMRARVPVN